MTLEAAIAEATGINPSLDADTVWVYGEVGWMYKGQFDLEGRTVTTSMVKRFRDGDSAMFLVEMPRAMARVLGLEGLIVTGYKLERLKGQCTKF
ncbi:MAG: hypothetical protein JO053_14445 [Acidobacteria bacterium]|nr:hypothetical protein [Acidobacteriota bacterium]